MVAAVPEPFEAADADVSADRGRARCTLSVPAPSMVLPIREFDPPGQREVVAVQVERVELACEGEGAAIGQIGAERHPCAAIDAARRRPSRWTR